MEYFRFVAAVIELLIGCEARYAIGGAFASSIYAEIRSTYDVDLTLQIAPANAAKFIKAVLERGWYITPGRVERAVLNGGDFQVIDCEIGLQAHCFCENLPGQKRSLERALCLNLGDGLQAVMVMSPEDVILYKLEWYRLGKSEKHLRDIGLMLTNLHETLEFDYVDRWVHESSAEQRWRELRQEYPKPDDQE